MTGLCFAGPSTGPDLPTDEGREVVQDACVQCHGVDVIVAQRRSSDDWQEVVTRMIGNGATLDDDQYAAVLNYLGVSLAPQTEPPAAQSRPTTDPLSKPR